MSEREQHEERMRRAGIRPPTRYEVTPEDLRPAVRKRPRWLALLLRWFQ